MPDSNQHRSHQLAQDWKRYLNERDIPRPDAVLPSDLVGLFEQYGTLQGAAAEVVRVAEEFLPEWFDTDENDEAVDGWDCFIKLRAAVSNPASSPENVIHE